MGSCAHTSLHQAINATASRVSDVNRAYPFLKAPGQGDWMPGSVLGWGRRWNEQIGGEILPAHVYHSEENEGVDCYQV
jgi:hypothetical protein